MGAKKQQGNGGGFFSNVLGRESKWSPAGTPHDAAFKHAVAQIWSGRATAEDYRHGLYERTSQAVEKVQSALSVKNSRPLMYAQYTARPGLFHFLASHTF